MEIVSAEEPIIQIKPGQARELGRANGLGSSDKTISRRHVSFIIPSSSSNQETTLQFEVLGRNPIYVSQNGEVKIFRRFERGEMESGDMFCVSVKDPVWYTLRKTENGGETENVRRNDLQTELAETLETGHEIEGVEDFRPEGVDISGLDPVEEFGFVIMGNEFGSYPKKMLRDIKNIDWFLEEAVEESDDDDDGGRKQKGSRRRKRKKGAENDDEEWTGESEDDKELIHKSKKAPRPKYITRSKDRGYKQNKDASRSKNATRRISRELDDEDVEDEDETLGGFIVDDENLEEEQEEEFGEEEEFEDEDEDEDE